MLNLLRSLKKLFMSVLRDKQFWYTILAEVSFAISSYFANRKARKTKRTK